MRSLSVTPSWLLILWLLCCQGLSANEAVPLRVTLEGVNGALHTTLLNDLSLSHLHNDHYPAQTDFLFRRARQELLDALRAHGYYQATVEDSLQRQNGQTLARFVVKTGPPVLIERIDIRITGPGANERAWRQYRQFELPLKLGQRLQHKDYEDTVADLMNIAINHGYLDAHFVHKSFQVNPHSRQAQIRIELDTAEPYLFGEVTFSDNTGMDHAFLKRFVEFSPGDHYSNATLAQLQQILISSRYFAMVRYEPHFAEQQDRHIPIHIHLEDNLPHRYRVGAGAGSDTGARLLFGFENRLLNKDGHRYEIDSVLGQRSQSVLFNYSIPGSRPARQKWNLRMGWDAGQSDTLHRSRGIIMPEYSYLTDSEWLLTPYVSLEQERYRYTDQQHEDSRLLLAGIGLQKRVLNQNAYPGKGYRHTIALRISPDNPVSDTEFMQLELASKGIISPRDNWRLIARAKLATTWTDTLQELPASYRYLLGGDTLRGYAYESIGLTDENGQLGGARHMALASLETDYRFGRWFGLAAFTDAGQVFERGTDTEAKIGTGIGLRGYTPVGVVRLDVARAISEDDKPWRIHFSLGLDL